MEHRKSRKIISMALAVIMTMSTVASVTTGIFASESLPMQGEQARKENQPKFNGYRILDIRDWSPKTDPYSEYLVAKVPLQKRNTPFKPTQANPTLETQAEIMLMQGDYGNVFTDPMMYNNTFGQNTLNYWQYTDYFSPWHGSVTASTPESLYDWKLELSDSNAWQKRYFEFGVLNIPNPSYTNAAHRNGVKSIACIYFDQSFRAGQTINELFVQDKDGKFPVAEKLIEMAKYFGYDGYFFNAEESVDSKYENAKKEFLARLTASGLYTQYYDTNSNMNDSKAQWLNYDINNDGKKEKLQDSVFINYGSRSESGMNSQLEFMKNNGIDPFKQAFYGVEANQNGFKGGHSSATTIPNMYSSGTKNLRASLALFTPSDYYQKSLPDDLGLKCDILQNPDYQWMIAERERMYFSGVKSDPTDTGAKAGFSRNDVGVSNAGGWVGVADFASERSVISGSVFHTNFNIGKGMQYFTNGKVTGDSQWTNITVQDILPTWQWWVESTGNKLKPDFDYGEKYYTGATQFTKVGAYNGGSSLVFKGDLQKSAKNTIHLYKTDLSVNAGSTAEITYNKTSASDATEMSLVLYLKDDPTKPVYLPISGTGTKTTGWTTKTVSLGAYANKEIAAFGLGFEAKQADANGYQINIGEIKIKDGKSHTPAQPTGLTVSKMYSTDEYALKWDLGKFDSIDRYDIYATLSSGEKVNVGSTYDNIYYVKSLLNEKKYANIELVAVGKDGTFSKPSTYKLDLTNKVSNLKASKEMNSTKLILQNKTAGIIELSWDNPKVDYKAIEFTAKLINSVDSYQSVKTVDKGITSVVLPFDRTNGEDYEVYARTVFSDGSKSDPMIVSGKTKDTFCKQFDADRVLIKGTSITLWQPESNDWHYIYAKVNGKKLNFSSRFVGQKDYAWRATTYMKATLPSATGTLELVMEDYSGNKSEPLYINYYENPNKTVDAIAIPNETLRNKIISVVGSDKMKDIIEFKGALDLSNLNINNYTGLALLSNITELNLTGSSISNITSDILPAKVEKLILDNSKNLEKISAGAFSGSINLKELSFKGCTNLKVLNVNDSTVERLITDTADKYTKLISLNLNNSRFDMTAGTSERIFADALAKQTEGANDIVLKGDVLENLALNATIMDSTTGDKSKAARLFDGLLGYFTLDVPSIIDFKLSSPQEIEKLTLLNDTYGGYGIADFKMQYSTDGKTWLDFGTEVTGSAAREESQTITPSVTAQYFRIKANKQQSSGSDVRELQLLGYKKTVYKAGVSFDEQKPNIQYTYPDEVKLTVNNARAAGVVDPITLVNAETTGGTAIEKLRGATFLADDYIIDEKLVPDNVYARVMTQNNDVLLMIPTDKAAEFTVNFTKLDGLNPQGKLVGKTLVRVLADIPDPTPGGNQNGNESKPGTSNPGMGDISNVYVPFVIMATASGIIIFLIYRKKRQEIK